MKEDIILFPIKPFFLGSPRLGDALLFTRTFNLLVLIGLKQGSALRDSEQAANFLSIYRFVPENLMFARVLKDVEKLSRQAGRCAKSKDPIGQIS